MVGKGRQKIFTNEKLITNENVFDVIQKAMPTFRDNARDCQYLLDFDAGIQPIQRKSEKKVMDWIDCEYIDNVAQEANDFWIGFGWGNPITLVQRGNLDSDNERKARGLSELNDCYYATNSTSDLQEIAKFIVKCGHCYTLTELNNEWEEGESYFTRDVLDPQWAFVVHSNAYPDKRVVLGVSLYEDTDKNLYITAYSKDFRWDISATKKIKTKGRDVSDYAKEYTWAFAYEEVNPFGKIPITEWYWTVDRTAIIESQINALNNINCMVSDMGNGSRQNIEAIWWANNVEFAMVEVKDEDGNVTMVPKKPKSGEWVKTKSQKDGANPTIQPLVLDYHLKDMLDTYLSERALALQKMHVPQRNDNSGGSTGVAMDSSTGYADAESIASARENIVVGCVIAELKVVLSILRFSPDIKEDDDILTLRVNDIEPAIRRPKNFDLATKSNAISTLLAHGFSLEDCVDNVPLFQDSTQVITRSGEGVKRYQETIFNKTNDAEEAPNADRTMQDLSDQVQNSPNLG